MVLNIGVAPNGGSITIEGVGTFSGLQWAQVEAGVPYSITASPPSGYDFQNWVIASPVSGGSVDNPNQNPATLTVQAVPLTLSVQWKAISVPPQTPPPTTPPTGEPPSGAPPTVTVSPGGAAGWASYWWLPIVIGTGLALVAVVNASKKALYHRP